MGRDPGSRSSPPASRYFNPLSPCGERHPKIPVHFPTIQFQPTLPVWGETKKPLKGQYTVDISTHSPRVGRDQLVITKKIQDLNFNPLSPCGERPPEVILIFDAELFQPTLPVWGETIFNLNVLEACVISTHSPRVGRDPIQSSHQKQSSCHFNPLSPCGERLAQARPSVAIERFQPTLPVWGETIWIYKRYKCYMISTHSPRVGRDPCLNVKNGTPGRFQPTLPVWGETLLFAPSSFFAKISTHSPRVGRDLQALYCYN